MYTQTDKVNEISNGRYLTAVQQFPEIYKSYAYAAANPVFYGDYNGLEVVLICGGIGAGVGLPGFEDFFEWSGGLYLDTDTGDFGIFTSEGSGIGFGASIDFFGGVVEGNACDLAGETNNTNVGIGPVSTSIFQDKNTFEIIGGTAGYGLGFPFTFAGTESNTSVYPVGKLW